MISSFADPTNVSPEPCVASSDVSGSNPDDCAAVTPHMVSFPFLAHPLTSATPIELQSATDTAPGADSGSDPAEDCAGAPTPPPVQAASTPSVLDTSASPSLGSSAAVITEQYRPQESDVAPSGSSVPAVTTGLRRLPPPLPGPPRPILGPIRPSPQGPCTRLQDNIRKPEDLH